MRAPKRAEIKYFRHQTAPPVASAVPVWLNGLKYKAVGAGVSEETEGQDTGAAASGADVAGSDSVAAVALALHGASREKADAFLDDQRRLIDEQTKLTGAEESCRCLCVNLMRFNNI